MEVGDRVRITETLRTRPDHGNIPRDMYQQIGQEGVITAVRGHNHMGEDGVSWVEIRFDNGEFPLGYVWPDDSIEPVGQRYLVVRFNQTNRNRLMNANSVYNSRQSAEHNARLFAQAEGLEYFVVPLRAVYSTNDPAPVEF